MFRFRAFDSDVRALPLGERPHKKHLPRVRPSVVQRVRDIAARIEHGSHPFSPLVVSWQLTGKTWAPGTRGDIVAKRVVKLGTYLRDMRSIAHAYSSVRRVLTEFLSDRPSDAELPVDTFFQSDSVSNSAAPGRGGRFGSFGGRRNQSFSVPSNRPHAWGPRRTSSMASDVEFEEDVRATSPAKTEAPEKCAACKRALGDNPIKWEGDVSPPSSPAHSSEGSSAPARQTVVYWFCSKACERYFRVAREKGYSITGVDGHRELRDKKVGVEEPPPPLEPARKKRTSLLPARWRLGGKGDSDSDSAATPPSKDAAPPPAAAGKKCVRRILVLFPLCVCFCCWTSHSLQSLRVLWGGFITVRNRQ